MAERLLTREKAIKEREDAAVRGYANPVLELKALATLEAAFADLRRFIYKCDQLGLLDGTVQQTRARWAGTGWLDEDET